MKTKKYHGIIPAFYACYDENGQVSIELTKKLAQFYVDKKVTGLYVGGSSGECIYLSKEERKATLEAVMEVCRGKIVIIAHVACNNTADSCELASHAQQLGVDAIAAIPPIYFKLPEHAIAKYWNDISNAASNTDFIIYNIPQLAGVTLTIPLLKTMLKNPRVVGVKNSSMPIQDIQMFLQTAPSDFVVFNGPDEQLVGGLSIGAQGGIGGTYGVMVDLYLKLFKAVLEKDMALALDIQNTCNAIIYKMVSSPANLYAVMKQILLKREAIITNGVRLPLVNVSSEQTDFIDECAKLIDVAYQKFIY